MSTLHDGRSFFNPCYVGDMITCVMFAWQGFGNGGATGEALIFISHYPTPI